MYVKISKMLKSHQNLFILAKGSGNFVGTFMSQKFLQISNLHAEAYACAEFRHGPLSMIDEVEKTPGKCSWMKISIVIFIVLDDEHKSQIISNIHQVKERGATTIILTNVADIGSLIDLDKLDYVVNLPTSKNDILAALQAIIPL